MTRPAFVFATLFMLCVAASGCHNVPVQEDSRYIGLYSNQPEEVMTATRVFGARRDAGAIPHLIDVLEHEDKWVRAKAHQALLLITDNKIRFGFSFEDGHPARKRAVMAWRAWYEEEGRTLYPPS